MPTGADIGSAVLGGLATTYKIFDSIRKDREANKIAKDTIRPVYNRAGQIDEVYDLAGSELNSDYEKDFASQQLSQNASAGIDAVLKSGGTLDFETANNSFGKGLQQALYQINKSRDAKVANYNNAAYNLAAAKDAEFQYNKDAPYKDAKQREAQLRQQAEQSKNEAFGLAASTISNYGIANDKPGNYGKVGGDIETVNPLERLPNTVYGNGSVTTTNTIGNQPLSPDLLEAAGRSTGQAQPVLDYFGNLVYRKI